MRQLLFKVLVDGTAEYLIYTDGEIEGFGKNAVVFNYFPQLLASDRSHRSGANGIPSAPACETRILTPDLAGAGHSTPE